MLLFIDSSNQEKIFKFAPIKSDIG